MNAQNAELYVSFFLFYNYNYFLIRRNELINQLLIRARRGVGALLSNTTGSARGFSTKACRHTKQRRWFSPSSVMETTSDCS